jgi:ABC-type bacteriocin/lantibiotic exporter with double-glycine peptidase domain
MYIGFVFFGLFRIDLVLIISTFVIAFFRFLPSLNRVFNSFNNFRFFYKSIDVVYEEFKKETFDISEKNNEINFKFLNNIELKNVSFSYDDKTPIILDKINLTINYNSITFIKGPSGTGKSTLLNIICGLLSPTEGQVLVDNKNINLFLKSYQSKIGYVPQKTLLLDDSILDNIIFGKTKEYDLNLVKEVINKSQLNKLVDKLPLGINTKIGERGAFLSGGEQQRIGIARALYKKPNILILDEATSALDDDTEHQLLHEILQLGNSMTIIIVSHKKLKINKNVNFFELINCKIINN